MRLKPRFKLAEYYETPWWKNLSRKTRAETPYCERCRSTNKLQVHHKRYALFRENRIDLEVLCKTCHLKHEHQYKDEDDMLDMDFNHRSSTGRLIHLIDSALEKRNCKQSPRNYLGGSRLGVECQRALQFEFFNAPKDSGKDFDGKTLRTFQIGHALEEMTAEWLKSAGLDLKTVKSDGKQFGFITGKGYIRGHIDGVVVGGPEEVGPYPRLWECKTSNASNWRKINKEKLKKANLTYYAQCQIYMAYMELTDNPALFTVINKDTSELYFEDIEFDPSVAQDMSDKGVRIIEACLAGEMLPRIAQDPSLYLCKWCSWSDRCWNMEA